jgi:hypothetical protein
MTNEEIIAAARITLAQALRGFAAPCLARFPTELVPFTSSSVLISNLWTSQSQPLQMEQ